MKIYAVLLSMPGAADADGRGRALGFVNVLIEGSFADHFDCPPPFHGRNTKFKIMQQ